MPVKSAAPESKAFFMSMDSNMDTRENPLRFSNFGKVRCTWV